jgi:hypothetical protein
MTITESETSIHFLKANVETAICSCFLILIVNNTHFEHNVLHIKKKGVNLKERKQNGWGGGYKDPVYVTFFAE